MYIYILIVLLHEKYMTQGQYFKRSLKGTFLFPRSVAIPDLEPTLPVYLPITRRRIVGCIDLPKTLGLSEMHTASVRISTRVTAMIFYKDDHSIKGASKTKSIRKLRVYLIIQSATKW